MSLLPGLRTRFLKLSAIVLLSFTIIPFNLFAQDKPKLSRNPNTNSERSSFRFKVSVLVNRNSDGYLYNYTLEQLDYGRLSYDSVNRFEITFPCGEGAYRSVKNLQSDGWQLNTGGNFFEPAIGKNKLWGLQFIANYQITPNGDNSTKGDKAFGFSFISKCAPTSGQWVVVGEQRSDVGEIDVPCGCDKSLTSVPNPDSRGYDDRDRDNTQTKNNPTSEPTPIETETNGTTRRQNTSSSDNRISVTRQEIIISPDTILKLKMESRLTSATAKIGDKFQASLFEDVKADQLSVLPAGCKVEGRVISVEPARKGNKSGTIGINFERLILPSKRAVSVVGELTSLSKTEGTKIDSEGHVEASSSKRSVVFIGSGAAGGAVIGAIAGGGKGAGIGAAIGAGAGILGVLLTNGQEAVVEPGTEFGLLLTQPLRIPNANTVSSSKSKITDQEQIFTDSKTIYAAQVKLRSLGYLRSAATSRISPSVKRAIVNYQNDNRLQPTGLIDYPTAISLGIIER
jgi:Putative peptidoglycan binding domain